MNSYRLLTILTILCCKISTGQKIQYSRTLIKTPITSEMQLMADVDGYHHLLCFATNKKPFIYIFNDRLQLHTKQELNITVPEYCDIRILQLKDRYLLYTHVPKSLKHQLIQINGNGTVKNVSYLLSNPADSAWNRSTATFQFFNKDQNIFIVSHSYFDDLKKIKSSIIKLEPEQQAKLITQVFFPFNLENEILKEITFNKNQLFVLKTARDEEGKNILALFKIDLTSGHIRSKYFESGKHLYYAPSLRYTEADSSFFVYSMITTPTGYKGSRGGIFMARLDNQLNELAPVHLLSSPFRENTASNFIVEKNKTTGWMSFSILQNNDRFRMNRNNGNMDLTHLSAVIPDFRYSYAEGNSYRNFPTAVRFTLLDNRFRTVKDSLVKNTGNFYNIHPSPSAQFVLNNKSYLLVVKEFVPKKTGLLLVNPNETGGFETVIIRAYSHYNFILSMLQPVGNEYFIVPFINKKEMGLMKVILNN